MGRIALRQAGTFQQFFPIKMDIPRFYPGFPRSFSAGKALFHVSFASFSQRMLKTGWKLLKTVCFFNRKSYCTTQSHTKKKASAHSFELSENLRMLAADAFFFSGLALSGSHSFASSPKVGALGSPRKLHLFAKASPFEERLPPAGGRCRVATKGGVCHRR